MTKKKSSVYNRHDHYIANKLKDIEKARAFFKAYLPDVGASHDTCANGSLRVLNLL